MSSKNMNHAKEALVWITNIIKKHNIPFQIAGGLAVNAYGSTRELIDIDIDIPEEDFEKITDEIAPFIIFGPSKFKDEDWDMLLLTLNYHGQAIDLSGAFETKIYDKANKTWVKIVNDFAKVKYKNMDGLDLPIIEREALIAYKKILSRPVDLLDVEYLSCINPL